MIRVLLIISALYSNEMVYAQGLSSSASQTIQMIVPSRIDVHNYLQVSTEKRNGKRDANKTSELAEKEYFRVKANKDFTVSVHMGAEVDTLAVVAAVKSNAVELKLSNMQPEINPFQTDYTRYTAISPTQQSVLMACACGTDQRFAVSYKARGKNNVVYTVTEP